MKGFLTGVLGLVALQVAVSSSDSAARLVGLADDSAGLFARLVSPDLPLIPDLRH